ncbi:CPBP family intramembrane glutamic endopeptidase [Virgibacillus flavescens]|uniref:CPBP family intramembrane glutamic endopeptidase n=1 Tax=Virgibacillus flavescens TaxID=1611422 RepID=UPI003D32E907
MTIEKNNSLLRHIIILSVLMLAIWVIVFPMAQVGGVLYNYGDWVNITIGITLLLYVSLVKTMRDNVLKSFKWRDFLKAKNILLVLAAVLLIYFLRDILMQIDPFTSRTQKAMAKYNLYLAGSYSMVTTVGILTIIPLWEELFFREVLIGNLGKFIPVWVCVALSIGVFALGHLNYPLFALVAGLILCIVYILTKSVAATFLIHALWDINAIIHLF